MKVASVSSSIFECHFQRMVLRMKKKYIQKRDGEKSEKKQFHLVECIEINNLAVFKREIRQIFMQTFGYSDVFFMVRHVQLLFYEINKGTEGIKETLVNIFVIH